MALGARIRAKGRLGAFLASIAFLLFALGAAPSPRGDDPANWSLTQWVDWRDRQILAILKPVANAEGEKSLSREDVILRSVDAFKFLMPMLEDKPFLDDPERAWRGQWPRRPVRFHAGQKRRYR